LQLSVAAQHAHATVCYHGSIYASAELLVRNSLIVVKALIN